MQTPSLPPCLSSCAVSTDSAPASAWRVLSPESWRVIKKRLPPSGEDGFPTFEGREVGRGSSVGVDGSLLAASSHLIPH